MGCALRCLCTFARRNGFYLHQLSSNKDSDQASSEWINLVGECAGLHSIGKQFLLMLP